VAEHGVEVEFGDDEAADVDQRAKTIRLERVGDGDPPAQ
jgi:hypothetical protein